MGVQGQTEVVWELTVEMQVSYQLSLPGHLSLHCTALPSRLKVGWLVTDFLALPAVPPHSALPHASPPPSPSANSLLAVEGVSEPEPSGRVGHRLYLAYFKFFQDQLPCQGRLASSF